MMILDTIYYSNIDNTLQKSLAHLFFEKDKQWMKYAWKEEDWLKIFELQNHRYHKTQYLLLLSVSSFALVQYCIFGHTIHLLKIATNPVVQRKGQGSATLKFILDYFKGLSRFKDEQYHSLFLEVETTNLSAIHFYEKNHGKKIQLLKNFYKDGNNAYSYEIIL